MGRRGGVGVGERSRDAVMMPVSYLVRHYTTIIQVYWYSTKLHCVVVRGIIL